MSSAYRLNFPVSWDQLHRDARVLARRLMPNGPFKGVVAITRGGMVPAAIVARELDLRLIDTVCIVTYKGDETRAGEKSRGAPEVLKSVEGDGEGMLLVDDLVDTGTTARIVRELLPKAHFATVYAKPEGRPLVDTFITEVSQDTWILFPWDSALSFAPPVIEDGEAGT